MSYEFQLPKRTVEVKINKEIHKREPENAQEALAWAVLDTTFDLLREYAVRSVLQTARESARAAGEEFPDDDEQIFADSQAEHGDIAPKNHLDLAPMCRTAALSLAAAYQHLEDEVMEEAGAAGQEQAARDELSQLGLLREDGGLDIDAALKLIAEDPDLN
jgi:hypothetical protein